MMKLLFIAFALQLAACKPMAQPSTTDVKTVDNFAAGAKIKNQVCGPAAPANLAELSKMVNGPDEKMRFAATQSLAALPVQLRGALFGDKLKGKVNIVSRSEVARQCRLSDQQRQFLNENGGSLDFCWTQDSSDALRFWVVADIPVIRHGLLRVASFAYLQLIEGLIAKGNSMDHQAIVSALKSARSQLTSVFLREVSSNSKFSANAPQLQAAHRQNAEVFDQQLFAEIVDSVYCSADSQRDFQSDFGKTFEQFVGRTGQIPMNFTKILGMPWHAR